jgi:hypothetical protein
VLHERIGSVLRAQGQLGLVLEHLRASHAIAERLTKVHPDNRGLQRDLAISHGRIGALLRAQRNLPGALDSYRAAFAIIERLAKADPEMPNGSARCRWRTAASPTCSATRACLTPHWKTTVRRSPSGNVWPRPTLAMCNGSATSPSVTGA